VGDFLPLAWVNCGQGYKPGRAQCTEVD